MIPDKPILTSRLQDDFYKLSMLWFIRKHFPNVNVTFGFKNRTLDIPLPRYVDIGEIKEQFDHARTLTYTVGEYKWIAGTDEYGERIFPQEFIDYTKKSKLPEYLLEQDGDHYRIEFSGLWSESTQWEIPCLMIINTLLNRSHTRGTGRIEQLSIPAQGTLNLLEKINKLKHYKYIDEFTFSDFGTRRCFGPEWQEYIVQILKEELPKQFRGTSNCYLAKKYDLMAMGTRAHEPEMVMAALAKTSKELRQTPFRFCQLWSPGTYGKGLQTHLPDTFGSNYFFQHAPAELTEWKAIRQDSGDPYQYGEKAVRWYEKHGQDTKNKILIPSDGLNVDLMIKLHMHFRPRIQVSPGWGTNLTNDLGLRPVSIIVKPIEANGQPAVKLSDNIAKATGDKEEVERYKHEFGYRDSFNQACYY